MDCAAKELSQTIEKVKGWIDAEVKPQIIVMIFNQKI